jgi:hypothetical protein
MTYLKIPHVIMYIYIWLLAYSKRFSIFLLKSLVFEEIFKNNFNIAENKIISVEATNKEHVIKCETI